MKSLIRRNDDLVARMGDALSEKTGILRQDIIVREPTRKKVPDPADDLATPGQTCDLCGRVFDKHLVRVIVQDKNKPVATMRKLALCPRVTACVSRFLKMKEG